MITLEERLRDHYADRTAAVPDRGPGLDAPRSLSSFEVDNDLRASRWRMGIIGSATESFAIGLLLGRDGGRVADSVARGLGRI